MSDEQHQNLAIIGHVDHGKSTLVGRLLYETGSVPEHVIEQHKEEAEEKGKGGFEFAYVMDNLAEERERGVTIDIAHQEFSTDAYDFTIVDCPGHRDFVKNMITGASQADNAVLVVAADDGVQPQTQEHVFLARTLGIGELIVAVNKMDLVDYGESEYKQVVEEVKDLLTQVRFDSENAKFIPVSAFEGDNIADESEHTGWYDGEILLEALNELPAPEPPTDAPLRLPIQDVYTISGIGTVPVGRVETGILNTGDNVSFQPSDVSGEVKTVEMHHEEVPKAEPGDNVGFNVRGVGKDDIRRGDVCGPADDPPSVAETFQAQIVVMQHPSVITEGYTPVFHAHTAQVACTVESIDKKIDPSSGEVAEENPDFIQNGDAAVVTVRPQKPLSIEPSSEIPELGSFAIRDMGQTIAAGKVLSVNER
ncbi:translation elongation factor EF-1 subunit alpha [Haloarcula taiwanensis]|uniref:Elongation factor 1-alpha n=1 Tax=Haloarcula taiwanensis TaxID=1932004 RepID=A0A2H5A1D3_9EURY|nr:MULTISPECIES: translation elongation factor EF-1 subunit alpha [Haloarcula]AUG48549.1 translation elongation factor EF-1 subunit alpha [Haloarcula taiwanensis]RLM39879.1 translation elongation factor EF-1 subunit alpha [Haloarcula sp. Atlit-120R]RLM47889.1 translation elongation factor EF-1 subunit alpha [Haloarcula sp. Atlit-47R]RLM96292.1 translation elongation factor EF-1 subunit alpha [Haloarcula sp. Atlit-7R]